MKDSKDKKSYKDYISDLLASIEERKVLKADDIPNIDLYMDQVTTFMDENLGLFRRSDTDKILTKTMINNYSKYHLLPPSIKKKYSNDHIILLLFIYYFKPILSIPDIKRLLDPMKTHLTDDERSQPLRDFFDQLVDKQVEHFGIFKENTDFVTTFVDDLMETMDLEEESAKEELRVVATCYFLSLQASAQQHLVTQLIDTYLNDPSDEKK